MNIQRKLKQNAHNNDYQNIKKQFHQIQNIKTTNKNDQHFLIGQTRYVLPWLLYSQHPAQKNHIPKYTMDRFFNKILSPKLNQQNQTVETVNKQKPLIRTQLQQYHLFKDKYRGLKFKNDIYFGKKSHQRSPNNISEEKSQNNYKKLIKSIKQHNNKFYKFIPKSIDIKPKQFVSPITLSSKERFYKKNNMNNQYAAQSNSNEEDQCIFTQSMQLKQRKSFSETKNSKTLDNNNREEMKQLKNHIAYGPIKYPKAHQTKLKKVSRQLFSKRRDIYTPWKKQQCQQQNIEQSLPRFISG